MTTRQTEIINDISAEIAVFRVTCSGERTHPARTSDQSDDFIKVNREVVKKLEEIRAELEILFYGEIV